MAYIKVKVTPAQKAKLARKAKRLGVSEETALAFILERGDNHLADREKNFAGGDNHLAGRANGRRLGS